jgi:hypothetical protein
MMPMPQRLRRGIAAGLVILAAVMPFHAFLSVWLGSLTGHQAVIQAWKELLLIVLSAMAAVLLWQNPATRARLKSWPVYLAGGFAVLAVLVTAVARPGLTATAFGLKTDLEFLVAMTLAVLVASPRLVRTLTTVTLAAAAAVAAFSLCQVYLLPPDFLTHFGYGPHTIQPYLVLDPAVHSLRFSSTLGGPNQLGTYLMLPVVLALVVAWRRRQWWWFLLTMGGSLAVVHSYSRSAWIGLIVALGVAVLALLPGRWRLPAFGALGAAMAAAALALPKLLATNANLQYYFLHSSLTWHGARGSDFQHLASLQEGLNGTSAQPLGHGLGSAGPAVFHSGQGIIIENNYLQIAYETGWAGLMLFVLLLLAIGRALLGRAKHYDLAVASLAALVGISVTSLVLPAWTDSTTALTVFIAAGSLIGLPEARRV